MVSPHLLAQVRIQVWGNVPDDEAAGEKLIEELDTDLDAGVHAVADHIREHFGLTIDDLAVIVDDE